MRAHRVSWLIHKGSIPDELLILHKCDIPSCVNPNHLFLGTHADNLRDRDVKGRAASGNKNGWFNKGHLQKGPNNSNYDHTSYTFEHKKKGWKLSCTRAYLIEFFNLNYTHVGSVISGKANTTGGWSLI
ncbi:HNH endonuclease [Candidatus Pacearchaeota archaeon]|nr:HNH endonuclease [Candidatus Pacearchaeota archaeon]